MALHFGISGVRIEGVRGLGLKELLVVQTFFRANSLCEEVLLPGQTGYERCFTSWRLRFEDDTEPQILSLLGRTLHKAQSE